LDILFRTVDCFTYNKMFALTVSIAYSLLGEPHQKLQNFELTVVFLVISTIH